MKMKIILFLIFLLIENHCLSQQDWKLKINDEWFKKYGSKGLMPGDSMPNILLTIWEKGLVKKKQFVDFRGKLIILDFWNTSCAPCIAAFPKMEMLQKKFDTSIQIILVNPYETIEQIRNANIEERIIPNLPMIFALSQPENSWEGWEKDSLYKLFPNRGVPHHVWIDSNGIIKLRGTPLDLYHENIELALSGKSPVTINSSATTPNLSLDKTMPYYSLIGDSKSSISYGSYITPYNKEISASTGKGSRILNVIDSIKGTRRTTFLNTDMFDIYIDYLFDDLRKEYLNKTIYTPNLYSEYILIPNDTLNYTSYFISTRPEYKKTNKEHIQSKYCYEQIVPLSMSNQQQKQYMLEDLNRYFSANIGTSVQLEKRRIKCFVLIRTSDHDKISSRDFPNQNFVRYDTTSNISKLKKERVYVFKGGELRNALAFIIGFSTELNKKLKENKLVGGPSWIFNETGFDNNKKVDMILPHHTKVKTINDLRQALKLYDLDIIETEREINTISFNKLN